MGDRSETEGLGDDVNDQIFQVDHLSPAYPGHRGHPAAPVLNDVSFTVERGRALTLVGPSGSGTVIPREVMSLRRESRIDRSSSTTKTMGISALSASQVGRSEKWRRGPGSPSPTGAPCGCR